jgi:flagellar biosynthesis/type III secretory pathway protein FliH
MVALYSFRFRVVQLNQLDWQDYEKRRSPILAALMANMHRGPEEAARVKLACLRMLAELGLDPARQELISGFIDAFLPLTAEEEKQFEAELQKLPQKEKEGVMEIITSWMEKGLEQGRQEGRQEGERTVLLRQLRKRLGDLDPAMEEQIKGLPADRLEELGEALFDFNSLADLDAWLKAHR